MSDFLATLYPWTKALHLIAVISWMAGLLYLPRLFVYHVETTPGSPESERFKVMERRLLRAIMNPAMILTYVFGLSLLFTPGLVDWASYWIWAKLALIVGLTYVHHAMGLWRKAFEADRNTRSQKFFRIANEAPTLMMIAIVILVVVRPF